MCGDLRMFLKFDNWSVGMILFEMFSGLKFERVFYRFYKRISVDNYKEFQRAVAENYRFIEVSEKYVPEIMVGFI